MNTQLFAAGKNQSTQVNGVKTLKRPPGAIKTGHGCIPVTVDPSARQPASGSRQALVASPEALCLSSLLL